MISNDPLYAAGSAWFTTTLFPGTRKCGVAVVTVIVYGPVPVLLILLIATKWLENRSTHMAPVGAAEGVEAAGFSFNPVYCRRTVHVDRPKHRSNRPIAERL